jgi:anti-sigma factor RsiW
MEVMRVLSCQEVVELVTDFLENALPPVRRAVVLEHLRGCDDCLRYLAQLQVTRRLLADVPAEPLPATERDALLRAYREWCAAHPDASVSDGASTGP